MTRIALVVQRYGESIVGGAESHARLLVERFQRDLGWKIDVFTTDAIDYRTWKSQKIADDKSLDGVRIFRFAPTIARMPKMMTVFFIMMRLIWKVSAFFPIKVPLWLERFWIYAQGPVVPQLIETLVQKESDYTAIIFFTYLYFPSISGLPKLKGRTILVPTSHDESPFYFRSVTKLFEAATCIAANTKAEADLIQRVHPSSSSKISIVGLGFEAAPIYERPVSERYVLYLGRICRGKGVDQLIEYFLEFTKSRSDNVVNLILAGEVESDIKIPVHSNIQAVGFLSETEKWRYIGHAAALINPSPHESLSMVAIESMALKIPLLLSSRCEVFRSYENLCPSVVTFDKFADFSRHLSEILDTDWSIPEPAARLNLSYQWAQENYSWANVLKKYSALVTEVTV